MNLIRPYENQDQRGVVDLWMKCGLTTPQNNPVVDIERKLKVNPEWFLVCVQNELVIGSCMVGYEGHRGWINYLAVLPEFQNRGIAKKLMNRAEELLIDVGCPKINLMVRSTNSTVADFYKHIGYLEEDRICLGKRLVED